MTRRHLIQLIAVLALLSGAACQRTEQPGGGTVAVTFHTGAPGTKASTPGDGVVADGGGIASADEDHPDLWIFIANSTGNIIKRYSGLGEPLDDTQHYDGTRVESDYSLQSSTRITVTFEFLAADLDDPVAGTGTYTVYAVANIGGSGGNIEIPDISSITTLAALDGLMLSLKDAALTADPTVSPDMGDRMPLSATGTLHVARGLSNKYNGLVDLEMLRCFAKAQITFKNLTKADLDLYDCTVKFHELNTTKGYLFPASPDFVSLGDGADEDTIDDNYRDYTSAPKDLVKICDTDDTATVDVDERTLMGDDDPATTDVDERVTASLDAVLFLPSICPKQTVPAPGNRYLCDISFKVAKAGKTYDPSDSSTYDLKEFNNLPIHNSLSQDIQTLERNQFLRIETSISKGLNVSFNFIVLEWNAHSAEVIFH